MFAVEHNPQNSNVTYKSLVTTPFETQKVSATIPPMRRKAWLVGLGCASIVLSSLCGCTWEEIFPSSSPSLPNAVALDRALRLCSLSESDQPFHLVLEISPPPLHASSARSAAALGLAARGHEARRPDLLAQDMQAEVEIYWLNPLTYRTVIRSRSFSQTRIVNGSVVEEHDTGDFYPRWIQNFVDAILDPIPNSSLLRKIPGVVPVGVESHACISNPVSEESEELAKAQICFQDAEPRIASGVDSTRSVWFGDFAPFGSQQIARLLVDNLPANFLVHGRVIRLEPLQQADYPLVRAKEFTPPAKVIHTSLVSSVNAQSLVELEPSRFEAIFHARSERQPTVRHASDDFVHEPVIVYIRTDRTGKVREAYRNSVGHGGLNDPAVVRALTLKFKPLVIDGIPRQMEASIVLPEETTLIAQAAR